KILAYVPVVRRLVAPLGYVSVFVLDDRETLPWRAQVWEVARLARRYEFWVLAVAVLAFTVIWMRARGRPLPSVCGKVKFLACLLTFCVAALFAMYTWNFKWVGLYLLPYVPLFVVLLGT